MELWSLMHFLMPHLFRSRKEFSYWFSNPLNSMVQGARALSDGLIRRLHTIMRPFLLRRLKKDVEKQLPGKFEHVVLCPLSRRQAHLYEEFMARSSTRAALAGGNFMGMMNVLMQLRKVCNHPDLFEARPIRSPYAMDPLALPVPALALDLLSPSSPLARALLHALKLDQDRARDLGPLIERFTCVVPRVRSSFPILLSSSARPPSLPPALHPPLRHLRTRLLRPYHPAALRQSLLFPDKWLVQFDAGKLQTLARLLLSLKRGHHRVLIFTQMTKMLDVLEQFLNLNGHVYLRLDGATGVDRRQKLMDRFNNDERIFCFILSTRSGGLGINLTGADTVIFYDSDWNPAMDAQAQDRAHRIGQTREVHIYR
ncbi:e1a binding protein p400 [Nannochloropsis gaditana]|uniref:E1a binding protein p400 n=1 Tax=Nannochloropsis gaditana TaxID=72520 RepID=W7T4M5_9STRA|nr:e1a binding protein p400 [Nannochloropsis gaditana]